MILEDAIREAAASGLSELDINESLGGWQARPAAAQAASAHEFGFVSIEGEPLRYGKADQGFRNPSFVARGG